MDPLGWEATLNNYLRAFGWSLVAAISFSVGIAFAIKIFDLFSANIDMGRAELVVSNLYIEKSGHPIENLDIESVNVFTYEGIDVLYLFSYYFITWYIFL